MNFIICYLLTYGLDFLFEKGFFFFSNGIGILNNLFLVFF